MTIIQEVQKKQKRKNEFQNLQKKVFDAKKDINFFEKGIFPYKGNVFKTKEKKESEDESEEESEENNFFKYIENESKSINYDLSKDYFDLVVPSALVKKLFETKDKKKNNDLVKLIKVRWSNLKDEIAKISEDEKKLNNQIKY